MNEDEVISIIRKISRRLSYKFVFGYHDREDIEQQAFIFGIYGLENYDQKRPLENFLWVHIANRLKSYKRDKYERPDSPCVTCAFYDGDVCDEYIDQLECSSYRGWYNRNQSKKNLMTPIEFENVNDVNEKYMSTGDVVTDDIIFSELQKIIDDNLPVNLRADYIKMISNIHVPKPRRTQIQEIIIEILDKYGYEKETR